MTNLIKKYIKKVIGLIIVISILASVVIPCDFDLIKNNYYKHSDNCATCISQNRKSSTPTDIPTSTDNCNCICHIYCVAFLNFNFKLLTSNYIHNFSQTLHQKNLNKSVYHPPKNLLIVNSQRSIVNC
jgi:hypothetical protein